MKKEVEAILKRFSAKLRQQEQAYRSLHDAARSLLSPKGRVFLLFLLFYKVLTNLLLVPALQLIWALTLRFAPIRYLNNKTASRIFASPAIIGCIAVLAVLAAFWSLYEIATMLQLLASRCGRGRCSGMPFAALCGCFCRRTFHCCCMVLP